MVYLIKFLDDKASEIKLKQMLGYETAPQALDIKPCLINRLRMKKDMTQTAQAKH